MITINLLAGGGTARTGRRHRLAAGCIVATCLIVAAYGSSLQRSRTMLRSRALETDARAAEASATSRRIESLRKRHGELTRQLHAIRGAVADRATSMALFEAVSRGLTDGVWLIELKRSLQTVQLDGRASSLAAIADLVRQLGANPLFVRGPEVRSVSVEDSAGVRVLRFQAVAELTLPNLEPQP